MTDAAAGVPEFIRILQSSEAFQVAELEKASRAQLKKLEKMSQALRDRNLESQIDNSMNLYNYMI